MVWHAYMTRIGFALMIILLGTSCAPPFPKAALEKIDRKISFRDLKANPERIAGSWIMAGGVIIDSKSSKDGNYIEVLQKPLGSRGRPEQTDDTEGRFLVYSQNFLDPAIYQRGRLITVIGAVEGKKVLPLSGIDYPYPLIRAEALHLWEPRSYGGTTFHFGVGVFHGF